MKKLLTRIAIAGSGLALLAGSTFAAVGNSGTGENSFNRVNYRRHNRTTLTVTNTGTVDNNIGVDANTGFNTINGSTNDNNDCNDHNYDHRDRNDCNRENVSAGNLSINTGDATAKADVTNKVNWTSMDVTTRGASVGDVGNMDTGRNSENRVEVRDQNTLNLTVDNTATVTNNIGVTANTGHNTINSSGRGDSSITTGAASASATVMNQVNNTSVTVQQ